MPTPFSEWDIEDAKIAAQLPKKRAEELASYRAALDGDLFQDWSWWIGPIPPADDPDALTVKQEIERGFVSRNVLGEVVGRHVNGTLGRDIKWQLVPRRKLGDGEQPTSDEQALIDEAVDLLDEWVEARKLQQDYDDVGETLLVAGRAYQRLFVAPGEVGEDGSVPTSDLATSLGRVYVSFPQPGEAALYTDPRSQRQCSVYLYREVEGDRPSQTQNQDGDERAELTYLDGDNTVVRILSRDGDVSDGEYSYPLGRRLLLSEMRRKPLLNPQVASQQKLLNLALTMKERNVILGGFLERVAINAQMDGTFETDGDGRRRFVPNAIPVGAGAMTTLTGYVIEDDNGRQTITTPNMLWREPVSVETFLATERSAYHAILAECHQLHYAMSDDATASGTSRQTAMSAYLIDLLQTKKQVDAGWAWLLETALALAAVLSGEPGKFDGLRVVAEASVDPGPISSEMITTTSNLVREGHLSHRTGLVWMGVDDPDTELAKIDQEQAAQQQQPDLGGVQAILERIRGGGSAGAANGAQQAANGAQPTQEASV